MDRTLLNNKTLQILNVSGNDLRNEGAEIIGYSI